MTGNTYLRAWRSRSATDSFPVSIILSAQLLAMVVAPAILKETRGATTIVAICSIAVAAALFVEALSVPLVTRPPKRPPRPVKVRAAWAILLAGGAASVGATLGGVGTYATQVGRAQQAGWTGLLTPFLLWPLIAVGLFVWLYRQKLITRSHALWAAAFAAATQAYVGFERAILGQPVAVAFAILVMIVLGRLIRLRVLLAACALIPLLWPTVYAVRDDMRREITGQGSIVSAGDPAERLQLDEQMSLVSRLEGADLRPPNAALVLRTGLIPGFLDPSRPPLNTSQMLSVASGGSASNSRSATFLGNVYLFTGWGGVAAAGACLALIIGAAMRRRLHSPWALSFVGLTYLAGISFNATYPNGIVVLLQSLQTLAVAYCVVWALSRERRAFDDQSVATPAATAPLAPNASREGHTRQGAT
ncbi:hypothetical protein ACFP3Q_17875 [Nocardioides sp. GCM10027113]|uniref:hypothetical protein n=1 Tax=unclassified Nocardioides TaxID=2615069 RepID=UPI00361AB2E8